MDTITTAIVERDLAASTYTLNLNGGLSVPQSFPLAYPWNLPSRQFRFPIELGERAPQRGYRPSTSETGSAIGTEEGQSNER